MSVPKTIPLYILVHRINPGLSVLVHFWSGRGRNVLCRTIFSCLDTAAFLLILSTVIRYLVHSSPGGHGHQACPLAGIARTALQGLLVLYRPSHWAGLISRSFVGLTHQVPLVQYWHIRQGKAGPYQVA